MKNGEEKNYAILTTGLFWILRARFAYFKVFRVSSALISAGLMQAEIEILFRCKGKKYLTSTIASFKKRNKRLADKTEIHDRAFFSFTLTIYLEKVQIF
jgi:hypothetical protein